MQVSVIGFNWQPGKGIFLEDFLVYLAGKGQIVRDDFILGVIKKDGYWTGLLLKIKDQQRFAKITQEGGGKFTITEQELGKNENPVDFNFFLINGATGRGLYQQYHQSTGVSTFTALANLEYAIYKEQRVSADAKKGGASPEKIVKSYQGRLRYKYWVRPEEFSALLERLKQIKALEVDVETDEVVEPMFTSIKEISKKETRTFRFSGELMPTVLRKRIVSFVKKTTADANIKVFGIDESDMPITLRVEDNIHKLSILDFDEVVKGLVIRSTHLADTILKSHMATHLLAVSQNGDVSAMLGKPQELPPKK